MARKSGRRWGRARTRFEMMTVALLLTTPSGAGAQAVIGGEWRDDVAAFAQRVVEAGLTPGMGLAVAVGDRVAWAEGFGSADLAAARAVTPRTPFYIASSTKSLTATAVVLAAHAGDVDLDSPMTRYLPEARLPSGIDASSIRVRDLLTLTHGLSGSGPIVLRTAFTGEFTRAELLELLRYHEPTGEQGEFSYNNLGYNLLGMVLEAVYDESWKDVVDRLVLEPLGMRSTTAYRSRLSDDHLALPHELLPEGFARLPTTKRDANLHAAGGHFATAEDLARYLAAHQSGGRLEGRPVLPEAPLRSTHRVHVEQDRTFGPFHRHGWGFGWDIGTYDGDTLAHRFGGFSGYRSHMSFMPEHELGVVVLVNGDGSASPAADLVATYAYDRLLGKPNLDEQYRERLDDLVTDAGEARTGIAEHLAERAARRAPLAHPLEAYAGIYESPRLGRMEWRVVAGGLEMWMGVLRSRAEVFDAPENRLRVEIAGSGRVVAFRFEGDGPARSVTLLGTGAEFVRVNDPQ
ncbi:MAG: serine hydrolase domain-containing protein [Gemmatimonadota bacterium]|nr:serine hydrolase domain-containing protein [Gemmatimonadota bacterium]